MVPPKLPNVLNKQAHGGAGGAVIFDIIQINDLTETETSLDIDVKILNVISCSLCDTASEITSNLARMYRNVLKPHGYAFIPS